MADHSGHGPLSVTEEWVVQILVNGVARWLIEVAAFPQHPYSTTLRIDATVYKGFSNALRAARAFEAAYPGHPPLFEGAHEYHDAQEALRRTTAWAKILDGIL